MDIYMEIGSNEPCICGSGKKYKYCCLNKKIKNYNLKHSEFEMNKDFIYDIEIMSEEKRQKYLIEFTKEEYNSSYNPIFREMAKYKIDISFRNLVLGTVESIYYMMHFKKPSIPDILWSIEDLEKICESENWKIEFVRLCKEIAGFGESDTKLLCNRFERGEKIHNGEKVLLTGLLKEFFMYIKLPMMNQEKSIDYNLFRLSTQFVLEVLEKKLLPEGKYIDIVDMTVDVKNGIEIVTNYNFESSDKPIANGLPYFIALHHKKPLFNYINILNCSYPELSQKTIKELSKAIEDEMSIDEYNKEYISLNPAYLSWVNSLERELRDLFTLQFNNKKKFNNYRLEQLIDFFFEKYDFDFYSFTKKDLHEVRIIRNKITHDNYEVTLGELKSVRELIYDSNFLEYINAVKSDLESN